MKCLLHYIFFSLVLVSCTEKKESYKTIYPPSGPVSTEVIGKTNNDFFSISADSGGVGFEKIAEKLGYQTSDHDDIFECKSAVKGGSITTTVYDYPSTFFPYGVGAYHELTYFTSEVCFETLFRFDNFEMEYKPLLATHWKRDGMELFIRLNPYAKFSNGKNLTSDDVIETLNMLKTDNEVIKFENYLFGKFEIEKISKLIVKVTLPDNKFSTIKDIMIYMPILNSEQLRKSNLVDFPRKYKQILASGTGPYIIDFDRSKHNRSLVFRRRSDYWGYTKGYGTYTYNFDFINFTVINDDFLIKERFRAGEFDIISVGRAQWWLIEFNKKNPKPAFPELERGIVKKLKVFNKAMNNASGIALNVRKAPLDNFKLRKALALLLDKRNIVKNLYYDEYKVTTSFYPGSIYENANNQKYVYNPELADSLLDESGWKYTSDGRIRKKNGVKLVLEMHLHSQDKKVYTIYQESLLEHGIELNLILSDYNDLDNRAVSGNFQLIPFYYSEGTIPDPKFYFHSSFANNESGYNYSGFSDLRVDSLIEIYEESFEQSKRIRYLQQIDSLVNESCSYIFEWNSMYTERLVYYDHFKFPDAALGFSGEFYSVFKYWWFDQNKKDIIDQIKVDDYLFLEADYMEDNYLPLDLLSRGKR
ncbi:MAG: hypothetical protein JXR48_02180 [Candidatus Delongbacteria bacterium]|nr:hypothetical protein [Candidatus Delongbacteria bacterium]MBN2833754.1 hypothetical protein [Candidatus Delongbacteria bacterium]